jgi:hypothetical protein
MSGQIVDASLVAAPRQPQGSRRALDGQIQQGQTARDGSTPPVDLAIPPFGYQNHVYGPAV